MKKFWNKFILIMFSFFLLITPFIKIKGSQKISLQSRAITLGTILIGTVISISLMDMILKKWVYPYLIKRKLIKDIKKAYECQELVDENKIKRKLIKNIKKAYECQELVDENKIIANQVREQLKKEGFSGAQTIELLGSKYFLVSDGGRKLKKESMHFEKDLSKIKTATAACFFVMSEHFGPLPEPLAIVLNLDRLRSMSYDKKKAVMIHEIAHVIIKKNPQFSEKWHNPVEETMADLYSVLSICQLSQNDFSFNIICSKQSELGYLTEEEFTKYKQIYSNLVFEKKVPEGEKKWELLSRDAEAILRKRKEAFPMKFKVTFSEEGCQIICQKNGD